MMIDSIDGNNGDIVLATVSHPPSQLTFQVYVKIAHILGEKVEPKREKGEKGSFVYYEERPSETYVIYILYKRMFEFLANIYQKDFTGLHIHECVNTYGDMICWPQKVASKEDAIIVLEKWAGLIGALLVSKNVGDLNGFYVEGDENWGENAVIQSGVNVKIEVL